MTLVNWGGAVKIKNKEEVLPDIRDISWIELATPKKLSQIKGNREQIQQVNDWFTKVQCNTNNTENSCLFVEGPSGVWKTTSVILCAKEHGYHVVHTQSDTQRTPHKLDSVLRKLNMMGVGGVLLLDEFESFIKETTSLRWLMSLLKTPIDNGNSPILVVVVCNATDKLFHQVRDISTVVRFNSLGFQEVYSTLLRLSQKIEDYCNLPPMDCYFVASVSNGNICQTVNQLQLIYSGTKPIDKRRKSKKRKIIGRLEKKSMQDDSLNMWFNSHRATSIDCFLKDDDILKSVSGMDRDFMNSLGENIYRDYVLYYHNSNISTLDSICKLADDLSLSDCKTLDMDEDRLYESENADRWSEDNINFIGCMCRSLYLLRGRERNVIVPKRHTKLVFKYC